MKRIEALFVFLVAVCSGCADINIAPDEDDAPIAFNMTIEGEMPLG
ncbi:hypothetical protein LJC29_02495 [Bacteroides sp. OttesenSCG-928-N06]|nr:hypothetical protein [Bacteroides sp. OttesenSCG-928-N06]